jgi:penicillin-insensitive murein endopeptidase
VELPVAGPGFERYRRLGRHHWGNPRLVRAVEEAARAVREQLPGGAPLVIGDLSARRGGKIPRHVSHRTGRDVDLSWFVTTPEGIAVKNPGFVNVGADGLAKLEGREEYVRLDVERQWLLVKVLLQSPHIDVQRMFCGKEVEALLVDHARARGEPAELVWRAMTVLLEPGDGLDHADHLHLRIACSPEETLRGCEGGGPRWDWLPPLPEIALGDELLYESARADPFPANGGEGSLPSSVTQRNELPGPTEADHAAPSDRAAPSG